MLPDTGLALGVFVVQARGHALEHGGRGEVLGGDHLQATDLAGLLLGDDVKDLRKKRVKENHVEFKVQEAKVALS